MNRWDYSDKEPFPYDDEWAYRWGMAQLADCEVVEDWGCGTAWAKRYRTGTYIGIDQAPGYADIVADLREYRSQVDGIFMRGVIEHNPDWVPILQNALASAPHLVLVIFTPMVPETTVIYTTEEQWPDWSFAARDVEAVFGDRPFVVQDVPTKTQYGQERTYEVMASARAHT